jgi:hypothetical protein
MHKGSKQLVFTALVYRDGERRNSVARSQYKRWRQLQDPPLPPERCDNSDCRFYSEPLLWNGKPFSPILEHKNGVNTDNRPSNLRFLCPNCDSQNSATRGGANKGRVLKFPGGFAHVARSGLKHYVMPAEPATYVHEGQEVELVGPSGTS